MSPASPTAFSPSGHAWNLLLIHRERAMGADPQSVFRLIPKLFNGVGVRAPRKPVKFIHTVPSKTRVFIYEDKRAGNLNYIPANTLVSDSWWPFV